MDRLSKQSPTLHLPRLQSASRGDLVMSEADSRLLKVPTYDNMLSPSKIVPS